MQTVRRSIRLHKVQAEFRRGTGLYRGFVGGRGSGKTWIGAYDVIRRAEPGRTYLIASPTYTIMDDTTLPMFEAIARELGVWRSKKMTPRPNAVIATKGGVATVRFRSAEDPDMLRGPNLSGAWLDEASLMHRDAFDITIASLRELGEQGWLSATFTPKGLTHWTYEVFGQEGKANTQLFHARTRDNPFAPPGFHDQIALQYSGLRAAQELDGRFVAIEGSEWPAEYFPDSIWFDDWPELESRAMALDPSKGKSDGAGDYRAYVWGGVDRSGVLWVDADLDRVDATQIVTDGLRLFRSFRVQGFAVEINAFQELLGQNFLQESRRLNVQLPLYGITNTINKEVRIRTLGPLFAQGKIRVRRSAGGKLLVGQLRDFPLGDHDDGPDALEMWSRMLDYLLSGGGGGQPGMPRLMA